MRQDLRQLLTRSQRSIMFVGMSGVGKTVISRRFDSRAWFHYSIDYRIGTRYLAEQILDQIKTEMVKNPYLRELLREDSITVLGNLSVDNLHLLTKYVGMLGHPNQSGLQWNTFINRQRQHLEAEKAAIRDIPSFQKRATDIYGYPDFLIDASGSICELPLDALAPLAENTLIVYIKASDEQKNMLIERAISSPKPIFYDEAFLRSALKVFLDTPEFDPENSTIEFAPNDFARWAFPKLIEHRLPRYQAIADQYGITVPSKALANLQSADEILSVCEHHCD